MITQSRVYCKAKVFPPLHVTLACQNAEQDLKAFKHSIKRRPSQVKRDFIQAELETIRWLQGQPTDIKIGNNDFIDDSHVLNTLEKIDSDRPIRRRDSRFFCFTEKITLAKRKDANSGRKPINRKRKQTLEGSNNSSCRSESNCKPCKQYVLYPRVQNCECCMRHSLSDAQGVNTDVHSNVKTYFNNCSMPRISAADIEVKGSGYGSNIGSQSKSKINKIVLCLPKIRVKRDTTDLTTKTSKMSFPKLTIYGKYNQIPKVANTCK